MPGLIEQLEKLTANSWSLSTPFPQILAYLKSGDPKDFARIPKTKDLMCSYYADSALREEDEISDAVRRMLFVLAKRGWFAPIGTWLGHWTHKEPANQDRFTKALKELEQTELPRLEIMRLAAGSCPLMTENGPTPWAQFLLQADVEEGVAILKVRRTRVENTNSVTAFSLFLKCDPIKLTKFLEEILKCNQGHELPITNWIDAANILKPVGLELAARALDQLQYEGSKLELSGALAKIAPARFQKMAEASAERQLLERDKGSQLSLWCQAKDAGIWLIENCAAKSIPILQKYFAAALEKDQWRRKNQSEYKNEVLDLALATFRREALPLLNACFETDQPEVQLRAFKHWVSVSKPADVARLTEVARKMLGSEEASFVARAVRLLADWDVTKIENDLWPLLGHKSRPVREAVAATLAKLGDSRINKTKELWAAKKSDTRIATVSWLRNLGGEKAADALRAQLEVEEDENVRDALLLALEKLTGNAEEIDPAELKRRIRKTIEKLDGPPVSWLEVKKLPATKLRSGEKLSADSLLYLLYRQSRVKEMRADIEAKPLYARIDRKTSGDLGIAVLQSFFGSKMDADDRWTMAFAALVGDDRLVPIMTRQIKTWADANRGKLSEYAVQALVLLGTDAALLTVDAMAIRYRSKNKNIGKAASEAFAEAARLRGLTVEELGDIVVPWLGFEPNKARIIETGKSRIEVRISNDFKFLFRDSETNKKLAKLPDSAPAEIKSEFKDAAASLKEAVKSQLLRMETLMVRQFRWPRQKWLELYLVHPLLAPFTQRLVWGAYDGNGKLVSTFRALEDRTLTDASDEPVTLSNDTRIGVVHPLELTPETRQAWLKHLADYDVEPPFAQLERPVILAKEAQKNTRFGTEVSGTDLNAMTFKGRAERLGWTRGSVCDAGCVNFYYKSFPTAGVDVFVETEGMYVGIDMYSDIKLGKIFFVKHASVEIGSYVYDEPGDESDPRLVPFVKVPSIAFSEAMGDLTRIAGKTETSEVDAEN